MTTQKKCSPALRFVGFTDDWEQRKLGEIAKFLNGRAYKQEELLSKGKYPVLRVGNFNTNSHWYYSNLELHEKFYAKKGDLLYTWATIFEPYIWEKETVIYHYHIWKIDLSPNLNPLFTLQLLKSDNSLSSNTNGSTMIHITKLEIENQIVNIPELKEQTQIGNFFKQLDETIALHKRKLKKQQNSKKFYLEKMFPKENSLFPEIRFPNFTDAWEQRKLGELGNNIYGGGTPNTLNEQYWKGDLPWFQSSDISEDDILNPKANKYISLLGINNSSAKKIPKNSISIVIRVGVGKVSLVPFDYSTSQDFLSICNLNTDKYFSVYAISNLIELEKNSVQGTSIKGVTKDELLGKYIKIPKKQEEQTQIGNFFKQLDETIALHKRMIEKLEKIKQAYLERMFI